MQQTKLDLNGKWALDMSLLESAFDKNDLIYDSMTLVISHKEPELRITRQMKKKKRETIQELIYYTDGRGEKNTNLTGGKPVRSKTNYEGSTIVSRWVEEFYESGDFYFCEVTDTWELSTDGQTLTHSTLGCEKAHNIYGRTIGMGTYNDRHFKRVFKRII